MLKLRQRKIEALRYNEKKESKKKETGEKS